jgi:hypothetical protein
MLKAITPVQWLGIILVINGALIGSTAQLSDLMGAKVAHIVVSVASLGNSVLGGLITFLSGQGAQIKSVLAMPGIESIKVNSQASPTLATIAIDENQPKIEPTPQADAKVMAIAQKAVTG